MRTQSIGIVPVAVAQWTGRGYHKLGTRIDEGSHLNGLEDRWVSLYLSEESEELDCVLTQSRAAERLDKRFDVSDCGGLVEGSVRWGGVDPVEQVGLRAYSVEGLEPEHRPVAVDLGGHLPSQEGRQVKMTTDCFLGRLHFGLGSLFE